MEEIIRAKLRSVSEWYDRNVSFFYSEANSMIYAVHQDLVSNEFYRNFHSVPFGIPHIRISYKNYMRLDDLDDCKWCFFGEKYNVKMYKTILNSDEIIVYRDLLKWINEYDIITDEDISIL